MPRPSKAAKKANDQSKSVSDVEDDDQATDVGHLLESAISKLVSAIDKKLSVQLEVHSSEIFGLAKRLDKLEKQNSELVDDNKALRDTVKAMSQQMEKLESKIDDVGQDSRSTSLLVQGVRDVGSTNQDTKTKVISLLNEKIVYAKIEISDVSTVEVMGARSSTSAADRNDGNKKVSPIILKFTSKESRDRVLKNRRQLKDTGVSITEQLTPRKTALLKKANDFVKDRKLEAAWSHDGKIIIKDSNGRIICISIESELDKYL